jgi:hypothetical protein
MVRAASCTAGERIARTMYSQGSMSQDELIRIVKGEEKYYKGRGPSIRDPITLEPIGACKFIFIRPNGSPVRYNVDSLIDYCVATGDFSEPESRLPFSFEDLARMDHEAKNHGLSKPSVVEARKNASRYSEMQSNRDLVTGLDSCAGEVVSQIILLIESPSSVANQTKLLSELLPELYDWIRQLMTADPAAGSHCLQQYMILMAGPPNRPIEDKSGLKDVVLRFLNEVHLRRTNGQ